LLAFFTSRSGTGRGEKDNISCKFGCAGMLTFNFTGKSPDSLIKYFDGYHKIVSNNSSFKTNADELTIMISIMVDAREYLKQPIVIKNIEKNFKTSGLGKTEKIKKEQEPEIKSEKKKPRRQKKFPIHELWADICRKYELSIYTTLQNMNEAVKTFINGFALLNDDTQAHDIHADHTPEIMFADVPVIVDWTHSYINEENLNNNQEFDDDNQFPVPNIANEDQLFKDESDPSCICFISPELCMCKWMVKSDFEIL